MSFVNFLAEADQCLCLASSGDGCFAEPEM